MKLTAENKLTENIFNLDNIDDIPNGMRPKQYHTRGFQENILQLFRIKDALTVSECIVGYYRKYGIEKKRHYFYSALNQMARKRLLVAAGSGLYKTIVPADSKKSTAQKSKTKR